MILVTGTGGSNGSELTRQLSAKGASVRAMVRKSSGLESDALPGVEFVTADFDDLASVNRALEGVQSAFLVTNSSERTETQPPLSLRNGLNEFRGILSSGAISSGALKEHF